VRGHESRCTLRVGAGVEGVDEAMTKKKKKKKKKQKRKKEKRKSKRVLKSDVSDCGLSEMLCVYGGMCVCTL
jgi:hypothetical protein